MLRWITIFLFLVVGSAIGLLAKNGVGEVVFYYDSWQVQAPMWFVVAGVVIALCIVALIVRFTDSLHFAWENTLHWLKLRKKSQLCSTSSLAAVALLEGNFAHASKLAKKSLALDNDLQMINYMTLAQAENEQGNNKARDDYIAKAISTDKSNQHAYLMLLAKMQLKTNESQQALLTLMQLQEMDQSNGTVIKYLVAAHIKSRQWYDAESLLPCLNKRSALSKSEQDEVGSLVYANLLPATAKSSGREELLSLWTRVPKRVKADEQVVYGYVYSLHELGLEDEAATVMLSMLKKAYYPSLVKYLVSNNKVDRLKAIAILERWQKNEHFATCNEILLGLGQLYLNAELWGKAKQVLEMSLAVAVTSKAYVLLGKLCDIQGDKEQALKYYALSGNVAVSRDEQLLPSNFLAADKLLA